MRSAAARTARGAGPPCPCPCPLSGGGADASARHGFAADGLRLTRIRHALVEIVRRDRSRLRGRDRAQDQNACPGARQPAARRPLPERPRRARSPARERLPCHRSRPCPYASASRRPPSRLRLGRRARRDPDVAAMAARSISARVGRVTPSGSGAWSLISPRARYQEGPRLQTVRGLCAVCGAVDSALFPHQRKKHKNLSGAKTICKPPQYFHGGFTEHK